MQNRKKKVLEFGVKEYEKLEILQESFQNPNYKACISKVNNACYIMIKNPSKYISFQVTTTQEQLDTLSLLIQEQNTKELEVSFYYYKESKYLMNVKRFYQTTRYTLSSYEILQKNLKNEYKPIKDKIAKGQMLEPSGPDFILGNYHQRILEGFYKIQSHQTNLQSLRTYKDKQGNLSQILPLLYNNEWVLNNPIADENLRSHILIHSGTNILESPLDRTEGCLLIGKEFLIDKERLLPHNEDSHIQRQYDKIQNKLKNKKTITQEEKEIIEDYNNSSIRELMDFIEQNEFEDFTIHIINDFRGLG